ncbi:MAG: transposase [Candidatus Omnitrophica bacterium]|nr:transposase [Candidatus Omnitrophota bacterium]
MARGQRMLVKNTYYHVYNRGNQKQTVFLDEEDYISFLDLLKHYKRKFGFKLYSYCLMPNHFHLIIFPRKPEALPEIMKPICQTYTLYFNNKYKKVGHLWQGRFKNRMIGKNDYLLDCIAYIESNPVRANLAAAPIDYSWSSYKQRTLGDNHMLIDIPDAT